MIHWDLSRSHTQADVKWPKPELDAIDVQPDGEVEIALPGGESFTAPAGVVRHAFVTRKGETVTEIQLNAFPRSRDDANELATRWAKQFGMSTKPIEQWYVRSASVKPVEISTTLTRRPTGETIGPDGPEGAVKVLYSSNEKRPWVVAFLMVWRATAGT